MKLFRCLPYKCVTYKMFHFLTFPGNVFCYVFKIRGLYTTCHTYTELICDVLFPFFYFNVGEHYLKKICCLIQYGFPLDTAIRASL